MKIIEIIEKQPHAKKTSIAAGILFAVLILSWINGSLNSGLLNARNEYFLGRQLASNGDQFRQRYEQILLQSQPPAPERISQNDWIRTTQDLIRSQNLTMRELTPSNQKVNELSLVLEGPTADIVGFLRVLSHNNDWVSVSRFKMTRTDRDIVEAELQLTQS